MVLTGVTAMKTDQMIGWAFGWMIVCGWIAIGIYLGQHDSI
jgi:hypothetical protein